MKFAKWVFLIAGIYGILLILPLYNESSTAAIFPPAVNHPEYYYGFASVVLAWQVAFIMISGDPVRYRLFMIPSILEKLIYAVSIVVLSIQGRIVPLILGFAAADFIWGTLFVISYVVTGKISRQ